MRVVGGRTGLARGHLARLTGVTAPRRTVVGAVLVDDPEAPTRVLAARRTTAPVGLWEFPGGKVEPGESPVQALRRELREELAVDVAVGSELGSGWPIDGRLVLRLFLAVPIGEPVPGDSHDRVLWLDHDRLGSVAWLPSDTLALAEVRARLRPRRARP